MRRFGLLVLGSAAAAGLALPRTPLRRRRSIRGGAEPAPAVKPFSAELKPQRASARDVFATAARHAWPKGDWPQHALVVAAVAFLVGQKLLNVRVPFLLSRVVDALQASEADKASQAAAAYVLGRVLTSACGELRSLCFARVSFGSGRRFARSTFASLHALPSSWHAKRATGDVAVAFSRGDRGFRSLLGLAAFTVGPTFLELALTASALKRRFGTSQYSLIALATFCAYALWTAVLVDVRLARRRRLASLDRMRGAALVDSLSNHEAVKTSGATSEEVARFDSILRETQRVSLGSQALGSLLNLGQALIFSSGLLASLKLALRSHFKDPSFSVGDVVAVNALLLQLAQPMNYLGYTVSEIRQGLVDVDAVVQASKAASAEAASNVNDVSVEKPPSIAFESVSARRDGEVPALNGASFEAPAGRVTVLCGASGSGKSTALRLLSGLDSVTEGLVKVDGARAPARPDATRCTVVAQDGTLFDETVAFNVRVGSNASDSEVAAALARVGLDLSLEARVGERGARLSGGERQRVLAARALVRAATPILLLDEPTSALDAGTERRVLDALLAPKDGMRPTTLIVAHRLRAVAPAADRVVVFDNGSVVASGTHDELLASSQVYGELWRAKESPKADAESVV